MAHPYSPTPRPKGAAIFYNLTGYLIMASGVALVTHSLIRRAVFAEYLMISLGSAAFVSAINLAHSVWQDPNVGSLIAWGPFLFIYGTAFAWPAALLVGLPFFVIRRRAKRADDLGNQLPPRLD